MRRDGGRGSLQDSRDVAPNVHGQSKLAGSFARSYSPSRRRQSGCGDRAGMAFCVGTCVCVRVCEHLRVHVRLSMPSYDLWRPVALPSCRQEAVPASAVVAIASLGRVEAIDLAMPWRQVARSGSTG